LHVYIIYVYGSCLWQLNEQFLDLIRGYGNQIRQICLRYPIFHDVERRFMNSLKF